MTPESRVNESGSPDLHGHSSDSRPVCRGGTPGGRDDGTNEMSRPSSSVACPSRVDSPCPSGEPLLVALAARFPGGFTAADIADLIELVGDDELEAAFVQAGFWRRVVTGAAVGQWLSRLRDRPAGNRVVRYGTVVKGYRRWRVEEVV